MARAKTNPSTTTGDDVEARVAQAWFWEGYYTRSGVDLRNEYGAELVQVTDHDLLATAFGPNLERRKIIGESKSGTGRSAPKALDRIVWLAGLQRLADADGAELTTAAAATRRVRELGRHLGVTVQSVADLAEREAQLGIKDLADSGSQGVTGLELRKKVGGLTSDDQELSNAYRFLTSRVWHIDSFSAAKQLVGLIGRLSKRYTPGVEDDDLAALTWLLSESVSLFAYNLTGMAGEIAPMNEKTWIAFVQDRLADGVVPASKMRELSPRIDKYVAGLLRVAQAPDALLAQSLGAFEPSAPEWAESIAELALRIKRSGTGQNFARQVDYVVFERMARTRQARQAGANRLGINTAAPFGAMSAFLKQYASLPEDFHAAITTPIGEQATTKRLAPSAPKSRNVGRAVTEPHRAVGSPASVAGTSRSRPAEPEPVTLIKTAARPAVAGTAQPPAEGPPEDARAALEAESAEAEGGQAPLFD